MAVLASWLTYISEWGATAGMSKPCLLRRFAIGGCIAALWLGPSVAQPPDQKSPAQPEVSQTLVVSDSATLRAIFDEIVKMYEAEKSANASADERKDNRDEAALIAQQDNAKWAKWAMCIAAGGLLLNGVTVGLVWLSFRETHKTANAAIDTAKSAREATALALRHFIADRRPWISVTALEFHTTKVDIENGVLLAVFTIRIENTGYSPAESCYGHLMVFDSLVDAISFSREVVPSQMEQGVAYTVFPGKSTGLIKVGVGGRPGQTPLNLGVMVWIAGSVFYRFGAGEESYRTPVLFRLQRIDAQPLKDFTKIPIDELTLIPHPTPDPA